MAIRFGEKEFDSLLIKDHAAMRMLYRNISQQDLRELIEYGEVIEEYPDDFPFPSNLVFKQVNNRPLHVVLAVDVRQKVLIIVTVYEPDSEKFEADFKTRKKA
jgi:hypothetical protein